MVVPVFARVPLGVRGRSEADIERPSHPLRTPNQKITEQLFSRAPIVYLEGCRLFTPCDAGPNPAGGTRLGLAVEV
jgi:hypothetical protein